MDAKVTGIIDAETERLVPLETRLHENARTRSIWRSGPGLLSFSRHGNESVEVECIPKHGDGHVDNVA
jgi:hypothetical protein